MAMLARSVFSEESESLDAGRAAGEALLAQFAPERPKAVLVYATMNHDHAAVLEGLRASLGESIPLFGCSVQGVVSNENLTEDGFALALMGFGGADLTCGMAVEREIQTDGKEKGRRFGQALKQSLGGPPKVIALLYDPLCRADVQAILDGLMLEVDCPVVGGAAGQPWGSPRGTFQYRDREVFSHGMVGIAFNGPFDFEIGLCHGTTPSGISSVITKADGNQILELDGRRAGDVWRETTGCRPEELLHQSHFATWALGVEVTGPRGQRERVIRGAFGINKATDAIILQAAVPAGTRVMLHHRTVEKILAGTEAMAAELKARLGGRRPWALLGFECAARTFPFLGQANTRAEHENLRAAVAPAAPWLGMMAWGEIGPCAGTTAFHNFTYTLLALTSPEP
jgi:hypothetical protein